MEKELNSHNIKIIFFISGLFLVAEGIGSFIAFADQNMVFQYGRLARIVIGIYLVYMSTKSIRD